MIRRSAALRVTVTRVDPTNLHAKRCRNSVQRDDAGDDRQPMPPQPSRLRAARAAERRDRHPDRPSSVTNPANSADNDTHGTPSTGANACVGRYVPCATQDPHHHMQVQGDPALRRGQTDTHRGIGEQTHHRPGMDRLRPPRTAVVAPRIARSMRSASDSW